MDQGTSNISSQFLLAPGTILLVGLLFSTVAQHGFLPYATLLLIFGTIIGMWRWWPRTDFPGTTSSCCWLSLRQ